MKSMKGSATMNSAINESPYGVLVSDRERIMPTMIAMAGKKNIAIVAHDNRKEELCEWAGLNRHVLAEHSLYATATTGHLLTCRLGLNVTRLKSGPLGGDQQIGSRIAEGQIDCLIFFSDPLKPPPHDSDVKALLRIAVVWNIPVAWNRASADFMLSSPMMSGEYERVIPMTIKDCETAEDGTSQFLV
jgi:methylglyoxal synthase